LEAPRVDVELSGRLTVVKVQLNEIPNYSAHEYTINILSKNRRDIILPLDDVSDGRVRAVFANDPETMADHVLPGESVILTIEANLGYYIDNTKNSDDFVSGVKSIAGGLLSMSDIHLISETGTPGRIKKREYQFYMPDGNVQFDVAYKPTVAAKNQRAYVAMGARRGGGFGSGADGETGKSWGTASNDLQAVINSWTGPNFEQIWVLEGTYTPPDPDDRQWYTANPSVPDLCFEGGIPSEANYKVTGYNLSGITKKEDIAFVLRPGLKIFGGFLETDDTAPDSAAAAGRTILSGVFPDGTRAHHVILAVDADGTELNTLTIAGAVGPETDSSITVQEQNNAQRSISRQAGGGIHNVNSSLRLSHVRIRNNKSTWGGGMYTIASGTNTRPLLDDVEFFGNTALESGGGMFNMGYTSSCIPDISNSRLSATNRWRPAAECITREQTACPP
jgi:hypothetical protein